MKVVADHREAASGILRELHRLDLDVEMQQLEVGDFILSERVGIERKTVRDFLQSLVDGRLLEQAKNLAETFERPLLILEGEGLYSERQIHPNAIRGALACITVDYHVPIISTEDESASAKIVSAIAKREQKEEESEVPVRSERKALTLSEMQRFVVEGLPGVSAILAKRLLDHFESVEEVMQASEEELMEVHGIGTEKARDIRRVLEAEYVSEEEE